jgi:tRNA dimethylallyltransferase
LTSVYSPALIRIPVLLGPTAVGKTGIALRLAQELGMEILSCDSRQIYRMMDIGTAKPTAAQQNSIHHWMLDVVSPDTVYSCYQFAEEALHIIRERNRDGVPVLVCGGTGLYYKGLSEGMSPTVPANPEYRALLMEKKARSGNQVIYEELLQVDPVTAAGSHPSNVQRNIRALEVFHCTSIPLSELKKQTHSPENMSFMPPIIGMLPRTVLYDRINCRVETMAAEGLWEEFCMLRARGYDDATPGLNCVGYKELFDVERGVATMAQALEAIKQHSRHYAKRQITWFSHQVQGSSIELIEDHYGRIRDTIAAFLEHG